MEDDMKDELQKTNGTEVPEKILTDQQVTEEESTPQCQACGDTGTNARAYGATCFCQIGTNSN